MTHHSSSVPVDVGDQVFRGRTLALIDPRDYEVALKNAEVNMERSKAKSAFAESDYERVLGIQQRDPGAISKSMLDNYEKKRENLKYYKKLLEIISDISKNNNINNIIDIGGWKGYFVSRTDIKDKYCFDLKVNNKNVSNGVIQIQGDFLKYDFGNTKYDIVCCCQVLEHIDDNNVKFFAKKLFELSNIVIISLPYKWDKNRCKWHKQDPVDEKKYSVGLV